MAIVSRVEGVTPRSSKPGNPGVTWSDMNSCKGNKLVTKEKSQIARCKLIQGIQLSKEPEGLITFSTSLYTCINIIGCID